MDIALYSLTASTLVLGLAVWRNARRVRGLQARVALLEAGLGGAVPAGDAGGASRAAAASARPVADISVDEVRPTQLYYCTADGKVALGVKKMDAQRLAALPKAAVPNAASRLSAVAAMLQAAPAVLTHARPGGGQVLEVLLNGAATAARPAEALTAMVRGATGKVVEQARLKGVPEPVPLLAAAVATTVMAVVARQQVQRLEHGLEQLKQALAALRPGPGMESRAAVSETLAYLHGEALPALERGELPAILGSEIEAAVRALAEAQAQLLQQHRELNQLTRGLRCEGEFDPDEFFKLLNEHIKKIDAARKQYVLLVKARLLGWQFLALFPRDAQVLQSLQASISEAAAAPDMALDYQPLLDTLVNRLDGLDETLSDDRTLGHRKEGMKVFTRNAFENTRQELAEVNQALEKATLAGAELQKNLRLAVKLEKGKMEMFELREVAAVAVAVAAQPVGEAAAAAA